MKQTTQLLIGNGKLARNIQHYFELLNVPLKTWNRKENSLAELNSKLSLSSTVLLALSDQSIQKFYQEHFEQHTDKSCIHFSGALEFDAVLGFHPLTSFTDDLKDLKDYQSIPFVSTQPQEVFQKVFPFLKNKFFQLNAADKEKYHALCVLAGNFSNILWKEFFTSLEKMKIPTEDALQYFKSCSQNLINSPTNSLTGPLSRGDTQTIRKNLTSLQNDKKLFNLYSEFVNNYGENL